MFKTIEDETARFGVRMTSQFKSIIGDIKTVLSDNTTGVSLGNGFNTILTEDETALRNYQAQLSAGKTQTEAFEATMLKASNTAKDYALSTNTIGFSVDGYRQALVTTQVTQIATNKSLSNCKQLINEYNSAIGTQNGLTKTAGLTQQEFTTAVNNGNARLGGYLGKLNGTKATMKGYISSLIGAKVSTIALQAATMALNMALSMGVMAAIQLVISAFKKLITTSNELQDNIKEITEKYNASQSTLKNHKDTIDKIGDRYKQLSKGVDSLGRNVSLTQDEFTEYNDICNQIAEMYPSLVQGHNEAGDAILSLKGNVDKLTEAYKEETIAANESIISSVEGINYAWKNLQYQYQNGVNTFMIGKWQVPNFIEMIQEGLGLISGNGVSLSGTSAQILENILNSEDIEEYVKNFSEKDLKVISQAIKQLDIDVGNYDGKTFTEQFINMIKSPDASTKIKAAISEIKSTTTEATQGLKDYINAYMQDELLDEESKISKLPLEIQQLISNVVNSLDYDSLVEKGINSTTDLVTWYSQIVDKFSELDDNTQKEFTAFFDIQTKYNNGLCTIDEYQKAVSGVENILQQSFDMKDIPEYKIALGIDDEEIQKISNVYKNFGLDGYSPVDKYDLTKQYENYRDILDIVLLDYPQAQEELDAAFAKIGMPFSDFLDSWDNQLATGDIAKWEANYQELFKILSRYEGLNDEWLSLVDEWNSTELPEDSFKYDYQQWLNGLSHDELNIVSELMLDTDSANWTLDQWKEKVSVETKIEVALGFNFDQTKEEIGKINDALSEANSASGLSDTSKQTFIDAFSQLEDYNESKLFERTANGIKVNAEELRKYRAETEKNIKTNFKESLEELDKQYDDLTERMKKCGNTQSDEYQNLVKQRNEVVSNIESISDLASQYDGLTSAYQKWQNASSGEGVGDKYDKVRDAQKNIKELYDKGLVGDEEFREYVNLLSGKDLSTASIQEVVSAYEQLNKKIQGTSYSVKDFLKDDSTGVQNFLNALKDFNLASKDDKGNWTIAIDDTTEAADKLGVSVEFVELLLDKLKQYGFDIDIEDDTDKYVTMATKLEDANAKLKELGKTKVDFNFNTDSVADAQTELDKALTMLNQFKNKDGTINLEAKGANEALMIVNELIKKKQELSEPAIMKYSIAEDTTNPVEQAISKLKQFQQAANELEQLKLNGGTAEQIKEASEKVQGLAGEINNLPAEVKTTLGLDTEEAKNALTEIGNTKITTSVGLSEGSVNSITDAISNIKPTVNADGTVTYAVDREDVDSQEYDKNATVTYDVDSKKVKDYTPPKKYGTVEYKAKVTGSANAGGTAFAHGSSGDWRIGDKGVSLGGELGEELLVRNGHWYTIGSDSAEFFKHQPNDIIFNHKQTEEIFKYGKITTAGKRGKAYASGTAFAGVSGSGNFHNGGSGSGNGSGSSSSSSSRSSSSSNSNSKSDKNEKDKWDWIEIKLSRLERKVKNFDKVVKNVYKTFSTRNSNITKEISAINNQITGLNQAQQRYLQEANKVALSSDIKKKVREGTINISEYSDETAKLIKEYQEWYEKSLDCKDAIDDLNESVSELYQTLFDNKVKEYEGLLGQLENRANLINTYIEQAELMGYRADSDYYTELIRLETQNQTQLTNERTALINQLNKAVNDGVIAENSEAWYEMKEEIDDVTKKIVESENAILEYDNTIRQIGWDNFDYLQETVSHLTSEADWLIDLMSNSDLFEDNGNMTDKGRATMGLHGLNYNTYMEQSMAYAREIQEIDKALAEDPADTKLLERRQELLETQREMITAAEQEKQAIKDMVADGIEYELDALQELIDKYQEMLDSQKDLYDYQKNVEKQTKEIASLQKQLLVYNQNDSDEGRLKRQQLSNSLKEAQDELNQTEYERYISDQKKLLDEMYDEYEEILNQRLDNIDVLIQTCIDDINSNSGTINSTIEGVAADVGYELSDDMQKIWSGSDNEVLKNYAGAFNTYTDNWNNYANATGTHLTNLQTRLGDINTNIGKLLEKYKIKAQDSLAKVSTSSTVPKKPTTSTSTTNNNTTNNNNSTPAKPTYNFWIHKKDSYPKSKLNISQSIVDRLKYHDYDSSMSARAKYYQGMGLGSSSSYKGTANQNISMLNWMKSHGYKHGVYDLPYGEFAWTNEGGIAETIIRPSDNAILTPLKAHDSVLNGQATSNIWKMANDPEKFVMDSIGNSFTVTTPQQNQGGSVVQNDINLGITLPNVKNYDQFLVALREDKRFEKLIQAITVDRLQGKSKLGKYNINIK